MLRVEPEASSDKVNNYVKLYFLFPICLLERCLFTGTMSIPLFSYLSKETSFMHSLILPFLDNTKDISFVCGVYNNDISLSDVLERLRELAGALKKGA